MRRALEGLAGVETTKLRFDAGAFDVTYDPAKVKPEEMVAAVKKAGFQNCSASP